MCTCADMTQSPLRPKKASKTSYIANYQLVNVGLVGLSVLDSQSHAQG